MTRGFILILICLCTLISAVKPRLEEAKAANVFSLIADFLHVNELQIMSRCVQFLHSKNRFFRMPQPYRDYTWDQYLRVVYSPFYGAFFDSRWYNYMLSKGAIEGSPFEFLLLSRLFHVTVECRFHTIGKNAIDKFARFHAVDANGQILSKADVFVVYSESVGLGIRVGFYNRMLDKSLSSYNLVYYIPPQTALMGSPFLAMVSPSVGRQEVGPVRTGQELMGHVLLAANRYTEAVVNELARLMNEEMVGKGIDRPPNVSTWTWSDELYRELMEKKKQFDTVEEEDLDDDYDAVQDKQVACLKFLASVRVAHEAAYVPILMAATSRVSGEVIRVSSLNFSRTAFTITKVIDYDYTVSRSKTSVVQHFYHLSGSGYQEVFSYHAAIPDLYTQFAPELSDDEKNRHSAHYSLVS